MSQSAKKTDTLTSSFEQLDSRISSGDVHVCVIGLGTAGLPFLTAAAIVRMACDASFTTSSRLNCNILEAVGLIA